MGSSSSGRFTFNQAKRLGQALDQLGSTSEQAYESLAAFNRALKMGAVVGVPCPRCGAAEWNSCFDKHEFGVAHRNKVHDERREAHRTFCVAEKLRGGR